jgi:hypothetical protein
MTGMSNTFFSAPNPPDASGAHLTSYSMGKTVLSRERSGRDVKLATHLYLAPRLVMNGAAPPLFLRAFIAWTGTTSLFNSGLLGLENFSVVLCILARVCGHI